MTHPPSARAVVLAGGVALGAFEAGACAALEEAGEPPPRWIVGASAGALNAAIWAAAAPGAGGAALRAFWDSVAQGPTPLATFLLGQPPASGAWRAVHNGAAALQTLLLGRPGLFEPGLRLDHGAVFYDMAPLRARLEAMLDFDRLNHGPTRLSLVTTDVETGARVVFDTHRGARLTPDHLLAAIAAPPLFAPVEVAGRRLVEGRAPLDLILAEAGPEALTCLMVDRPEVPPPSANPTRAALAACAREWEVRARMGCLARHVPEERRATPEVASLLHAAGVGGTATVVLMAYRAGPDEAGPAKAFDFSEVTLADRWGAGAAAAAAALARLATPDQGTELAPGLHLHEVTGTPPTA